MRRLRESIVAFIPGAEECTPYGIPAFRVSGTVVAGFAVFKNHLCDLPFSGSVLGQLPRELAGYEMTKSSLHFPVDRPHPNALVQTLIDFRLKQQGTPASQ